MNRFFNEADLPLFLTLVQVADLLQVSTETVARRARNGKLPCVPGLRCYRFPREEILQALRDQDVTRGPG
jgi:excisionase family DNA binding protein